jgi:hypothetical protein
MKVNKESRSGKKQSRRKAATAKDGYLGSYHKNLDLMKLLVSDPDFQTDIQSARRCLNIPKNGLEPGQGLLSDTDGTNDKKETWYSTMLKKSDSIVNGCRDKTDQCSTVTF